ncbi:MAG: sensor histidine kinase [Lachnospiraceae bacterium]
MKVLRDKYNNLSSFFKITVLFEAVLITSLFVVTMKTTNSFSDILREKEVSLGENRIENVTTFVQEKYNRFYGFRNYIHSGEISEIMTRISTSREEAYNFKNISDIQVFFSAISYADESISDAILVSMQGDVYSYTRQASYEVVPSYDFLDEPYIKKLLASDDNYVIESVDPSIYSLRPREKVISFVGKIYDATLYPKKIAKGIFIMNIPLSEVENAQAMGESTGDGLMFVISNQDQILYSQTPDICGNTFHESDYTTQEETYVSRRNVGTSGIYAEYILPESIMFAKIYEIRSKMIGILICAIIITMVFAGVIYYLFQKRMKALFQSMEAVQQGNLTAAKVSDRQDEIGRIMNAFHEMCEQLNRYVEQVYLSEIQRKNAEINALQTQIDPHFLYNTLESIKAKALLSGDDDAAEMITILGNMFRWSSKTGKKVASLEEELEYVKNYLTLQSYRYNQQLDISIDVKEEYLDYMVPKLILQPIIENVIKHALDGIEGNKLVGIYARKKDAVLEITVYDNGRGIPKEQLEELWKRLSENNQDEFESIGIQNVNQRLKLMYGAEYGLKIQSIENQGTAVKILLPV